MIYGEGAIGGVVNVVPRKPTRGPIENEIRATIGTENTQRMAFDSSGAISDQWSYRLDVSGNRSDGWVDFGNSKNLTLSGALQWDPTSDLSQVDQALQAERHVNALHAHPVKRCRDNRGFGQCDVGESGTHGFA